MSGAGPNDDGAQANTDSSPQDHGGRSQAMARLPVFTASSRSPHHPMTAQFLYGGAGMVLFVLGVWSFLVHEPLLRKLIALNIMGGGVFHVLIAIAYRGDDTAPDPVPHALVLTGIVVAVSATALALALGTRLDELSRDGGKDAGAAATRPDPATRPDGSAGGLAGDA